MSKIPYTVNVDEYVCTELERMRTMCKTYDFSGLLASIERVQFHVSRMEDALYSQKSKISKALEKESVEEMKKALEGDNR